MNGMKQGLIIGVVAGLLCGFMLGRFGMQQANMRYRGTTAKGGNALTKMSELPRGFIRPKDMKGIKWSSLLGSKKVRTAYVLNRVLCKCGSVQRSLAYCIKYAKRCKPGKSDMRKARAIVSQIRDGADYKRILSLYAPRRRRGARAPKAYRPLAAKGLGTINRTKVVAGNDDPSWGPKNALVTIVEFSDFQCPYCSRGAKVIDQVKKAYKGRVRIVFKHLPLSFHRQAHLAAQASMAAKAQGKFWPYHDKLFANYRSINKANMLKWAKELGLNMTKFKAALDKGTYKAKVNRDLRYSRSVGARGTPNFFINGRKLGGAQPFGRFKQIIDQEFVFAKRLMKQGVPRAKLMDKLLEYGQKAKLARMRLLKNIPVAGSPAAGPANAKVTIYEFSDFQCPFCSRGANDIDQLKKA
jgi:protein-disulfide isomerase